MGKDSGIKGGAGFTNKTVSDLTSSVTDPYTTMTKRQREIASDTIDLNALIAKMATETGDALAKDQITADNLKDTIATLNKQEDEYLANGDKVTDVTSAKTQAYKDYNTELQKAQQETQKLQDLDQDYITDLQNAGRDPTAIRSAMQSYARSRRSILESQSTDITGAQTAATEYNQIAAGVPLAQVAGTSQYTAAQAAGAGSLSLSIGNVYLSKDYTLTDMTNEAATLRTNRTAMGVPTRTS
jgi:hypothetical protein